jgi:outer membrane translocation and assembly module TamA
MEQLDEKPLLACLATRQREKVSLGLAALRDPECGVPPFDNTRAAWDLFSLPWKDWPVYDEAVFKLDLKRVERWYNARGFYGANVARVDVDPPEAADPNSPGCQQPPCEVSLTLHIEEGEPVRIRHVRMVGAEGLDPELRTELAEVIAKLEPEDRFDEASYDLVKEELGATLREAGYARAEVAGDVALHRGLLWADVTFKVDPRQLCKIGDVRIRSASPIPSEPVLMAAKLKRGAQYRESDLQDAQRAIYALGAFAAVSVRGDLEGQGEQIDIILEIEPRRESEISLGLGVMSGVLSTGPAADEWVSVPQWDAHLLGRYEHRNFLGGLRRLRLEERPRLLFLDSFPRVPDNSPRFGNAVSASFSQPGIPEARTIFFTEANWDYGPDPFLLFFRHDFSSGVGLERGFFKQRLHVRGAIHQDIMQVSRRQPIIDEEDIPSSYRLPYLEQRISLDLRDDAGNPTKGAYFRVSVHEAARLWEPSWNYVRVTPEARGYAPLGLGLVLAARFAVGSLHVFDASSKLDDDSKKLGPQSYRLRGGGAQSNRGFGPGQLGDGISGGSRRWESSLELRVPLTNSFSVAAFSDVGDVHAESTFRFRHLNTAVGGGVRYRTIIGPIRLDVGYRPDALQRTRGEAPEDTPQTNLRFVKFNGAIHLTIGESF